MVKVTQHKIIITLIFSYKQITKSEFVLKVKILKKTVKALSMNLEVNDQNMWKSFLMFGLLSSSLIQRLTIESVKFNYRTVLY